VKKERNILLTIKRRKANLMGHILCGKCLLQHGSEGKIEGKVEVTVRRGRRRKQLRVDLNEMGGYCKCKQETLDRALWRTRFGKVYGPVVRQSAWWWNTNVLVSFSYESAFVRPFFRPQFTVSLVWVETVRILLSHREFARATPVVCMSRLVFTLAYSIMPQYISVWSVSSVTPTY
jgi:hypothetical protein